MRSLLFVLFVLCLMLFACSERDKDSEPYTARFFCDAPGCAVWYGVYDSDMRHDETGKCWQDAIDVEPGQTLMLNCETDGAAATLLLAIYCGSDCVAFGQAGVEAHSSGEILIKNE